MQLAAPSARALSPAEYILDRPRLADKSRLGIRKPELMKYLISLVLLIGCVSTAWANTFRLECLDSGDGKTRLALIEINTDAATVQVYSETGWRTAVNVSIADSTISYVLRGLSDASSATTSATINRVTGKYFAYSGNSARKDGECKRVP
jgi:hypothetical protein